MKLIDSKKIITIKKDGCHPEFAKDLVGEYKYIYPVDCNKAIKYTKIRHDLRRKFNYYALKEPCI